MMTEKGVDGDGGDQDVELSKCLVHLPRKWNSDNLKKFLSDHGILFKSVKKKEGMTVGFVSFENSEQIQSAVEELEGKSIGNKNLKVANVVPRSFDKKIKSAMALTENTFQCSEMALAGVSSGVPASLNGTENGNGNDNNSEVDGSASKAKSTRNACKACPNGVSLPEWIMKSKEIGGLPCKLERILESPLVNGFHNKLLELFY